jgi:GTP-binding protein
VGYTNSGKSTLISALSAARPTIAEYSFTTTGPVLGTVDDGIRNHLWAEMPALTRISAGIKGPGIRYLSQTRRASVILYLLDASSGNLEGDWQNLKSILSESVKEIDQKASVVAVNKIDLTQDGKHIDNLKEQLAPGCPVFYISAKEKIGLDELVACVNSLIEKVKKEQEEVIQPLKIFRPKPVDKDH